MSSVLRLVVCGGLFIAGYYLGRQSCKFEALHGHPDDFGSPDIDPEKEFVDSGQPDSEG